jgi:cytochrome c553
MKPTINMTLAITLACTMSACSGDSLDGAQVARDRGCVACHGNDGMAIAPSYPNLNGQWKRYLRIQLREYRSGDRENLVMNGMAATLTDPEIRALADHYGM